MALVACRDCSNQVSTFGVSCPNCGALVPKKKRWPWIVGVPVVLFIIMMIYGSTIPEYRHTAREARNLCEEMVKKNLGSPTYNCEDVYRKIITKGEEAERSRSSK